MVLNNVVEEGTVGSREWAAGFLSGNLGAVDPLVVFEYLFSLNSWQRERFLKKVAKTYPEVCADKNLEQLLEDILGLSWDEFKDSKSYRVLYHQRYLATWGKISSWNRAWLDKFLPGWDKESPKGLHDKFYSLGALNVSEVRR
ncbi:MAG: hypothetical protein QM571_02905 [Micrococcaceae bacterium]